MEMYCEKEKFNRKQKLTVTVNFSGENDIYAEISQFGNNIIKY